MGWDGCTSQLLCFPIANWPPVVLMWSSSASPSPADRLATACDNGDLPSAKAAVADGASVNERGPPGCYTYLPLAIAVRRQHHDVAAWLLSHGADPNGDSVMLHGARYSTVAILQLLIDAGGDVNRYSGGAPPLYWAVAGNSEDRVRVLLAQPSLDLTIKWDGKTPERYARAEGAPALATMIAQEVSGKGLPILFGGATAAACVTVCVALLFLTESETSETGTTTVMFV